VLKEGAGQRRNEFPKLFASFPIKLLFQHMCILLSQKTRWSCLVAPSLAMGSVVGRRITVPFLCALLTEDRTVMKNSSFEEIASWKLLFHSSRVLTPTILENNIYNINCEVVNELT
jgi:hypothetical protein